MHNLMKLQADLLYNETYVFLRATHHAVIS